MARDDDDDDGRDIFDRIIDHAGIWVDWEKSLSVLEGIGTDQFDLDAEAEELRARFEDRQERAFAILRGLGEPIDHVEAKRLMQEAGLFDEGLEQAQMAAMFKAIRMLRERRN
jgi:hypothetical protein